MGADNWGVCPQCARNAIKAKEALAIKVQQAYGNVPEEEYLALALDEQKPIELEPALREDYEIGTGRDGVFYVSYSCHCNTCGFTYKFKKTEEAHDGN